MATLNFTLNGQHHWIRVLHADDKPDHIAVYEGLADGQFYIYWETLLDDNGYVTQDQLFADAMKAYIEHEQEDTVVKTRWREEE